MPHRTGLAARLAGPLLLLAAVSACGGGDSTATPASASLTSASRQPVAPQSAATPSETESAAEVDCGSAEAEVAAGVGVTGFVTGVQIVGGCTQASVSTSLGTTQDDVGSALALCEIAATQAYSQGVSSVTVLASDQTELAVGVQGSPCAGEPKG